MANHANSKKMIRVIKRRTEINRMRRNKTRTLVKKVELAVESGIKENALIAFREAESNLHKCVSKKILHRNTAARRISRLSAKVKSMNASTQVVG